MQRVFMFSALVLSWLLAQSAVAETVVLDYIKINVNNEIVTYQEFRDSLAAYQSQIEQAIPDQSRRQQVLQVAEQQLVENIVAELLLVSRAKQLKIPIDEERVDDKLDQMQQENPQLLQFYAEDKVREKIRRDIYKDQVIAMEVDTRVHVSSQQVQSLCQQQHSTVKEREIFQILFRGNEQEARTKTQQIQQQLQQGTSFEALARQWSEDPNATNTGGRLGLFQPGQLLKEIDQVAFQLQPETLSSLVQSDYGWHLIYTKNPSGSQSGLNCSELPPAQYAQLENQLHDQQKQKVMRKYIEGLKDAATIRVR